MHMASHGWRVGSRHASQPAAGGLSILSALLALYPRIDTVLYLFPFLPAERAAMALRLTRFPIVTLAAVAAAGPRSGIVKEDPRQYDGVPHGPPVFRVQMYDIHMKMYDVDRKYMILIDMMLIRKCMISIGKL